MISQLEASTDKQTPTQTYHNGEPAWALQLKIEHTAHCVNGGNMQISIKSILMPQTQLWGQMKITCIESFIGNSRTD